MSRALVLALLSACVEYDFRPAQVDPEEVTECGFTAVDGGQQLLRYDCNPVFTTTDESWASTLGSTSFNHTDVMGHPFYQIWYVGQDEDGGFGLGYAVSPDGTTWQPHPDNPTWPVRATTDWDAGSIQRISVAWDPNIEGYAMLYGGISPGLDFFGIGVAASSDGSAWELSPENPVMDLGLPYDGIDYAWSLTLDIGPGRYDAYFAGETEGSADIYRIRTSDIESWNQQGELVFEASAEGGWDDSGFRSASVVELDGTQYLFYVGFGTWIDDAEHNVRYVDESFLGLATSTDGGESWERREAAPLPLHNTEHGDVAAVAARAINGRIHLWVTDRYEDLDANAVGYFLYEPS